MTKIRYVLLMNLMIGVVSYSPENRSIGPSDRAVIAVRGRDPG